MGVISALAGLGSTLRDAGSLAEVFVGNRARLEGDEHAEFIAALEQLGAEFNQPRTTWFDSLINGLNRLPRPSMALGTIGLFVYAMADPVGFASRMQGLSLVPEPLWWLLGAIVSFYFGARELHYFRSGRAGIDLQDVVRVREIRDQIDTLRPQEVSLDAPVVAGNVVDPHFNAAVEEWRQMQKSA